MQDILHLLQQYHYYILFPLAIVGGAVVAIVSGFLISLNQFSFLPVISIIILGDMIGDTILYSIGRWGMVLLQRHGYRIGITTDKLDKASELFGEHHRKAVYLSKIAMAIGIVGLVAAGCLRVNYWHYMRICITVTFIRSVILIVIGYFFGSAYKEIERMMNVYAAWFCVALFAVIVWWAIQQFKKSKISKN